MVATTTKINNCSKTGSVATLQARHELAKLMKGKPGQEVETDDLNENDVRVVASSGDNASRWAKAKDADDLIAEWNAANATAPDTK
ncbi:MAG: hypothetical protein MK097_09010 [Dechloromonas sp.]|nr:hypothetical protein [Dechloromonas sp.]